ncbi:uncharacterized protein LOC119999057 [Tripterygium wilfordii]|uniref:uncharacterized protein LOC119999057 n=1 Tax=Tripterygium wilfordii TaxID=458696 RepID=UPI0018F8044E|nr:uncharacterized protein LOC119999057 [Tripterygium wilfordii]
MFWGGTLSHQLRLRHQRWQISLISSITLSTMKSREGLFKLTASKPRPEILALFGRVAETLRPDGAHFLSHLRPDMNSSIYAATHPELIQNPSGLLGLCISQKLIIGI